MSDSNDRYDDYSQSRLQKELVQAMCNRVDELFNHGYDAYHLTIMFKCLYGRECGVLDEMIRELEMFNSRLVTRLVRRPRSPSQRDKLPMLFFFPDVPGYGKKMRLRDVRINNGVHYHGVALIHPNARLTETLDEHLTKDLQTYLKAPSRIAHIDCRPIHNRPGSSVLNYDGKSVNFGRLPWESMVVFPRAPSELSKRR